MTELIPRQVLFGNPDRISPELSPDGSMLSWLAPDDGVLNIWVQAIGGGDVDESAARVVTDDRDRGIRDYTWAHDGRHLLYIQDQGGDEDWHVYAVDVLDGGTRDLTPFAGVQAQLVDVDEDHPDVVLLGINADDEQLHDVYECALATGTLTKVCENPGFIGWVADHDMRVRGAAAPTPDGGLAIMVRDTTDAEWRPLLVAGQEDALTTSPISFDREGGRMLCISSVGANTGRLVWVDTATAETTVIAEDPRYDVAGFSVDPHTKLPRGVAFQRDRLRWEVLDDAVRADFERLGAHDPGDWQLVGRDTADTTWLVAYNHDDGPVGYWRYERASGGFTFLFDHQPALAGYQLAPMEPFSFEARDGLRIDGYVTWPVGVERSSLPAVLNVHGGPWARDTWGYHPEAQWLANRGYACIQVDYRGSTGYGKAHVNAGDKEWGAKMHTDLLDAVDHLVGTGAIDPDRVAIYGGSYGGYAALVGAAFTPERFRCAVDIVGPSNLQTLIESIPPYWAPMIAQFHTRLGNPETDADLLWERSPLSRVDDIAIPVLIAQGANDPRVKQAESEQIVAAMAERGIPHEYLLFEDEGHGFAKPENRLRFYARAEAFLAEHLGGRHEE
jgi:dipeptidyl aminopeptidase/acylaminoacyl peptidase